MHGLAEMMDSQCNRFALTSRLQLVSLGGEFSHKSAETDVSKGSPILVDKNQLGAMMRKWEALVEKLL